MQISAGGGLVPQDESLRHECDAMARAPGWAWKLFRRLSKLERGHAYTLTIVMLDGDPVWILQAAGKLENEQ